MIESFDLIAYFEDRGISYHTSGKNVTKGWINIQCPFSFCSDSSWHCGINIDSKMFHCWICNESGSIKKLIKEIEDCSWVEVELILREFQNLIEYQFQIDESLNEQQNIKVLPKECTDVFPKIHLDYLKNRNFDPYYVINKYKLKACYNVGKYKFRIIAPVIFNNNIVNFIARDVTGKARIKYLTAPNNRSLISIKKCLYNIDSVKNKIVFVEGIVDVWKIGDGAVATFGKQVTKEQIKILLEKDIKEVYILPDKDALEYGVKLADNLSVIFDYVELLELDRGDPAELDDSSLSEIRKLIN